MTGCMKSAGERLRYSYVVMKIVLGIQSVAGDVAIYGML